jgi:GPH family glycoside/pentoside/hexuronide:cation symporter
MAKLPLSKKIFYGVGELGVNTPGFFLPTYIFLFYSPLTGHQLLSSYIVGIAMFVGTAIQAIANPYIGNWSDKLRSRFGRRKFFIVTGFLPLAILFGIIWFPLSHGLTLAILLVFYLLSYNFLFAYVVLPYLALIPELTIESKDRVVLTTIAAYFSIGGIILASLLPAILLFLNYGYGVVGAAIAIIIFVSFLVVYVTIDEKPTGEIVPREYSLWKAIVQTFKNKTFNRYIIAYLFFQFGFYFFLSSLGYYVEGVVLPGNPNYSSYVGIFTLIAVIFAILFSPLLVRYSNKNGEKKAFILFTAILGLAMILTVVVGLTHIISNFLQVIPIMIIAGLGLTSYFILPNAIVSEIIDEDETISGYRREGMYFGVQGFLERIPSGLAGFVLGYWISDLYMPTHNIVYIRLLGVVGGLFTLATSIMFFWVPLKQDIKSRSIKENE